MSLFSCLIGALPGRKLTLAVVLGVTGSAWNASADVVTNINMCGLVTCGQWNSTNQDNGDQIAAAPNTGDTSTGIIFANYNGQFIAICPAGVSCTNVGSATMTLTSPILLNSNATVDTLINNFFGTANAIEAVVTFTNSNGATDVFSLVGGQTVRDYNNYIYTNSLAGANTDSSLGQVTAEEWWNNGGNGQRLDVQTFVLPSSWAGTSLTSIKIVDPTSGDWDVLSGILVDDGAVTTAAPEPGTMFMVFLGAGALLFARRRRVSLS